MGMIYAPPSIIPNGALINNVCHIYQTTRPTTRPDGSALVIGDKWYNSDIRVDFFWNGTYWLSSPEVTAPNIITNLTSVNNCNISNDFADHDIFINKIVWTGRTGSNNSGTNYRQLSFIRYTNDGLNTTLQSNIYNTSTLAANTYFNKVINYNRFQALSRDVENGASPTVNLYYMQSSSFGSPGAVTESLLVNYSFVAI